jgi:cyclin L
VSCSNGMHEDVERELRANACALLEDAGRLLGHQRVVIVHAEILLHRLLHRTSLIGMSGGQLASLCAQAALYVAGKARNSFRSCAHIVNVFYNIERRLAGSKKISVLPSDNPTFLEKKAGVFEMELRLLRALGYILHVDLPHQYLQFFCHVLGLSDSDAPRIAWNFLNDSLRTDACVRYEATTIACASIAFAARVCGISLPGEEEEEQTATSMEPPTPSKSWWELFDTNASGIHGVLERVEPLYRSSSQ